MDLQKVFTHFKQIQPVFLASVDGKKPRVRPVTLIYFAKHFWFAAGSGDDKVAQIYNNENIEFCLTLKGDKSTGYIRGAGKAVIVEDLQEKIMIAENIDFIKHFWQDPADPDYTLFKIELQEIEYLPIGEMIATRKSIDNFKL